MRGLKNRMPSLMGSEEEIRLAPFRKGGIGEREIRLAPFRKGGIGEIAQRDLGSGNPPCPL